MSPAGLGGQRWPFVALLTMTAVWGSTFFLIKDIVTRIPVPDLLTVRFAIATIALATMTAGRLKMSGRTLARGLMLGLLYGTAQLLQTVGLDHTAASVSGFLTGLYVVATPLLAAWILRTTISSNAWLASVLATVGLAVLSLHGFAIGYGELLTCVAALIYAGHIIALGQLSQPGEALSLSVIQLLMITAVCAVGAVASGGSGPLISLPATGLDWLIVVYLAVVASAVTMVLQTWAQARVEPSRAAVVMAMEPVWAAAFAIALGGETMTVRMIIGGLAIVAAMYLVMRSSAERGVRSQEDRLDAHASDLRSR
jgi:drug/metabolite transporter (DMT)-like permease